ncbi:12106_t:CDS:2, partial [Entrophospora sp. SA101]
MTSSNNGVTRAIGTATNAIKGQIENTADKVREVIKDHPLASLAVASVATAVTQATANRFIALMAGIKVSSYFINISPEEWKFSEFYKYRQQENDFTSSFRKEAFILRRSLDYLMKEGSSEVKNYATLLDKNFKGHRTSDMDSKLFWDKIELQLDFHAEIEMREREMRLAKVGTATGIMKRIDGALIKSIREVLRQMLSSPLDPG